MSIETRNLHNARCPRCGYELRGLIESWRESCPLLGICSECGLKFIWSEVLHPEKYEPLWCVEFPSAGPIWRSALKTYLRSFLPWRFFSELKMANAVRWKRLLAYVTLLITSLLTCYVIEQSTVAILAWRLCQQELSSLQTWAKATIPKYEQEIDELKASEDTPAQQIADWQAELNSLKATAINPGSINVTLTEAVFEAIIFPLRRDSQGLVLTPMWIQTYPAPINLHAMVMVRKNRAIHLRRMPDKFLRKSLVIIIMQLALFPGIPLAFLLMPVSRHVAKVRLEHIFRVLLYSLFLPVTVFCLLVMLFSAGTFVSMLEPICYWMGKVLFTYATWIALIVWWALATKHYLKMLHGWIVALLFALIVMLLTLMALFLFTPSLVIDIWTWM